MATTIGIIGVGNIRGSHLQAINALDDYELVGVCRRSEQTLKEIAGELGVEGYTDYRDLLAAGPQVVAVCLPHGMHCEATLAAFEAGCHVLVEKPMAVSVDECNGMLEAAARLDKRLIVTEGAAFYPGAALTGEKFRAGELGRFFTGSIINERFYFHEERPAWFLDPAMSGGGMFSNVGVHRLAVARACIPDLEPVSVSASVSNVADYQIEACTSAIVKYAEGGAMLYEEVGYYQKPAWLNVGTHLVFEEGIVMWDDDTWRMMPRNGEEVQEPLPDSVPPYQEIYENMLSAIRGEPYWPPAWECAADVAVAQAAYASQREGREILLSEPEWTIHRG